MFKAGEVNNEAIIIKFLGSEPESEASAVSMDKSTMPRMFPLSMATGVTLKMFATAIANAWDGHLKHV